MILFKNVSIIEMIEYSSLSYIHICNNCFTLDYIKASNDFEFVAKNLYIDYVKYSISVEPQNSVLFKAQLYFRRSNSVLYIY